MGTIHWGKSRMVVVLEKNFAGAKDLVEHIPWNVSEIAYTLGFY